MGEFIMQVTLNIFTKSAIKSAIVSKEQIIIQIMKKQAIIQTHERRSEIRDIGTSLQSN